MKISVVTVCFNSQRTIAHTIRSFQAQSHGDRELLVIDGKSNDKTLDIVSGFADSRIRVISEHDRGIYDAMNKGLRLFSGEAIGFLNSDDTFHDHDALSRIAAGLDRAEAVHGGVDMVSDHETKRVVRSWKGEPFERGAFGRGWMPPHPTFYVRRALAKKTGEFDLRYPIAADYDYMLRALELHAKNSELIPGVLVDFMMGGNSTSNLSAVVRANLECLRSRRENLGVAAIDAALFLKPLRKIFQLRPRNPLATGS